MITKSYTHISKGGRLMPSLIVKMWVFFAVVENSKNASLIKRKYGLKIRIKKNHRKAFSNWLNGYKYIARNNVEMLGYKIPKNNSSFRLFTRGLE